MKRISYYQTWKPYDFVYDKIEISQEFPLDKPDEECFRELRSRVEAMAKIAYPWLFEQAPMPVFIKDEWKSPATIITEYPSRSDEKAINEKEAILNCKTVPELQGFRLIKDKSPELKEAYAKKLKELLSMDSVSDLNKNGKEVES